MGEIALSPLAYLIQEWKYLQITLSVLVFCNMASLLIIPESPRWLIAKNKIEEALMVLKKGASTNKKTLPKISAFQKTQERKTLGIVPVLTDSFAVQMTCIMSINWMVTTLCYYGLSLNAVNLAGTDPYINFALSGLIEIASYVFAILMIDRIGRKTLLVFCQLLGGGACLAAGLISKDMTSAVTALTLIGNQSSLFKSTYC